ncbi:hypothetical protein [Mycobacterium decipiens]|uniref:Uncharacterized protein n=1 Tax=Mycobacterium decipiens TaxID=1430326 RepID=A0A1X2LXZ9_9MYCO|nr:hypothetical protein [Mycobacterium decipiens]OSC42080.1 hypothetical protein B8W66_06040 [Mycobacterium decipiens]
MTTMTMTFCVPQRVNRLTKGWAQAMLRVGRRMSDRLSAPLSLTAQQRADRYVARMPIAVIAASR